MANSLDIYGDAICMKAFLTRDFSELEYEFEDNVITKIKGFAFADLNLTKISLSNLEDIGPAAFYNTQISNNLTLPWNKITTIDGYAFIGSNAISYYPRLECPVLDTLGYGAFYQNTDIISFSAPNMTEIGDSTYPTDLVDIPSINLAGENVIGIFQSSSIQSFSAPKLQYGTNTYNMFRNCSSLTTVNLPKLTSLGSFAFEGCTNLQTISLPLITSLYYNVFAGCTSLISVSLPLWTNSNTTMSVFKNCTALQTISLPSLEKTGYGMLEGCTNLISVNLPMTTIIGGSCFANCSSLTQLLESSIPLVTTCGTETFRESGLTSFTNTKITTLGNGTFYNCSNLQTVELSSITTIPRETFYNCSKLTRVTISSDIESVGQSAFRYCYLLNTVILSGVTAVPTIESTSFWSATLIANKTGIIYVPDTLVSSFEANSIWGQYNIQPLSTLPS